MTVCTQELSAWHANYTATLAGICWSMAAQPQQPPVHGTAACHRPPLVIYLISPTDDCHTALSCLSCAASQLSQRSPVLRTSHDSGARLAAQPIEDVGAQDSQDPDMVVTTPAEQQAEENLPDSVAHVRHVVLQVLLPTVLQSVPSHVARQTALAVHSLVA